MAHIWLRYANGGAATSLKLNALECRELDDVERDSGRTLRRINYAHRLGYGWAFIMTIGADELVDPAKYAFIRAWFRASERWFTANPAAIEPTVTDESVTGLATDPNTNYGRYNTDADSGRLPVTFIEGNKGLPSFSTTLVSQYPRG